MKKFLNDILFNLKKIVSLSIQILIPMDRNLIYAINLAD